MHPAAVRAKAVRLYRDGRTMDEVAARFGVCKTTVHRWTHEAGVARDHLTAGRMAHWEDRTDPKVRARALDRYRRGHSSTEVARQLSVSPSSVCKWAREAGILRSPAEGKRLAAKKWSYPEAIRKKAIALYRRGWSGRKVGEALGIPAVTIMFWGRTAGIVHDRWPPRKHRGGRKESSP